MHLLGGARPRQRLFPVRLLSPVLGRCDVTGAAPVCRVSFVIADGQGDTQPVGGGMGVTLQGGQWKFLGTVDPVELYASAAIQRHRRSDGDTPVDRCTRALAFEIAAVEAPQCARVRQRNQDQQFDTVAWFKRFAGERVERLSLWAAADIGSLRSLDPARGALRSADDSWVTLPEGDAGDTVVRNVLRAGRMVAIELCSDAACTTSLPLAGKSSFEVEVQGVPPVWHRCRACRGPS